MKNKNAGGRVIRVELDPRALQALNDLVRFLSARENTLASADHRRHGCVCGDDSPHSYTDTINESWSHSEGRSTTVGESVSTTQFDSDC